MAARNGSSGRANERTDEANDHANDAGQPRRIGEDLRQIAR